eukprot:TRINITY_DN7377_c1_g2_i3.p3 TRINITY_DN7377_c1_g2~~TRINITY_DN7377_c1_g2_i3.p3  ORF type:complete len:221 (-),score=33.23 TRINITY_DN7377_c1_g2_i3:181-843(-)
MTEHGQNCVWLESFSKPINTFRVESSVQPELQNSGIGINSSSEESELTATTQISAENNMLVKNEHDKPIVKFYENLEQATKILHQPSPMKLKPRRSCLKFEKRDFLEVCPGLNFDVETGDEMEEDCSSQFEGVESFEDRWARRSLRIDKLSDSFKSNKITSEIDQFDNSNKNNNSYNKSLKQQTKLEMGGQENIAGVNYFQQVGQEKISRKRSRISMILE